LTLLANAEAPLYVLKAYSYRAHRDRSRIAYLALHVRSGRQQLVAQLFGPDVRTASLTGI